MSPIYSLTTKAIIMREKLLKLSKMVKEKGRENLYFKIIYKQLKIIEWSANHLIIKYLEFTRTIYTFLLKQIILKIYVPTMNIIVAPDQQWT